jgi:hypothetical protein
MNEFDRHLRQRGLRPQYQYYKTECLPNNHIEEHVVFPFVMPGGRYVGHQRYFWRKPKLRNNDEQGRYVSTFLPEYNLTAFYGWPQCRGVGPLFVTEGIWDSIRVSNCGFDCIALLCNSPNIQLRKYIRLLANGAVIVALIDKDENKAGEQLASSFDFSFEPAHGYVDFNDMPQEVCELRMLEIMGELL